MHETKKVILRSFGELGVMDWFKFGDQTEDKVYWKSSKDEACRKDLSVSNSFVVSPYRPVYRVSAATGEPLEMEAWQQNLTKETPLPEFASISAPLADCPLPPASAPVTAAGAFVMDAADFSALLSVLQVLTDSPVSRMSPESLRNLAEELRVRLQRVAPYPDYRPVAKIVAAVGNPFDGVVLYGPFTDRASATEWAERRDDWHIITLEDPEN